MLSSQSSQPSLLSSTRPSRSRRFKKLEHPKIITPYAYLLPPSQSTTILDLKSHAYHSSTPEPIYRIITSDIDPTFILPGSTWSDRISLNRSGLHPSIRSPIVISQGGGAQSLIIDGTEACSDNGDCIWYVGSDRYGSDDSLVKNPKILASSPPRISNHDLSISQSYLTNSPIRLIRGSGLSTPWAPSHGYRYDGLYVVTRESKVLDPTGSTNLRSYVWRLERILSSQSPYILPIRDGMLQSAKTAIRLGTARKVFENLDPNPPAATRPQTERPPKRRSIGSQDQEARRSNKRSALEFEDRDRLDHQAPSSPSSSSQERLIQPSELKRLSPTTSTSSNLGSDLIDPRPPRSISLISSSSVSAPSTCSDLELSLTDSSSSSPERPIDSHSTPSHLDPISILPSPSFDLSIDARLPSSIKCDDRSAHRSSHGRTDRGDGPSPSTDTPTRAAGDNLLVPDDPTEHHPKPQPHDLLNLTTALPNPTHSSDPIPNLTQSQALWIDHLFEGKNLFGEDWIKDFTLESIIGPYSIDPINGCQVKFDSVLQVYKVGEYILVDD